MIDLKKYFQPRITLLNTKAVGEPKLLPDLHEDYNCSIKVCVRLDWPQLKWLSWLYSQPIMYINSRGELSDTRELCEFHGDGSLWDFAGDYDNWPYASKLCTRADFNAMLNSKVVNILCHKSPARTTLIDSITYWHSQYQD